MTVGRCVIHTWLKWLSSGGYDWRLACAIFGYKKQLINTIWTLTYWDNCSFDWQLVMWLTSRRCYAITVFSTTSCLYNNQLLIFSFLKPNQCLRGKYTWHGTQYKYDTLKQLVHLIPALVIPVTGVPEVLLQQNAITRSTMKYTLLLLIEQSFCKHDD